jgi:hypothetical protein
MASWSKSLRIPKESPELFMNLVDERFVENAALPRHTRLVQRVTHHI